MKKLIYPERDLQELFTDLHESGLFPDGKEISDAILDQSPNEVLAAYRATRGDADFDLNAFYQNYFKKAPAREVNYTSDTTKPVEDHIEKLWDILARLPEEEDFFSSRIQLPYPYVVPGGRFNEIYYWDSYFTMLGLEVSGRIDLIEGMVKNFAYMIEHFGFIPNGNRSYYLGRSQPPFFSLMVKLLAQHQGEETILTYLHALEKEYAFWMAGSSQLIDDITAHKRVVRLQDGVLLNRYYDNIQQPRDEMYQDDIELIETKGEAGKKTLVDIRAACESGWDFSSRWCEDPARLDTIRTTDLVEVDLNCLLYHLESLIAEAKRLKKDPDTETFLQAAERRKVAIEDTFWNQKLSTYSDYLWKKQAYTSSINAAALYPLYFEITSQERADSVAAIVEKELLEDGGLLTTNFKSGQQWDAPNGWAPLQWIGIQGLRNYGHDKLADKIKANWCSLNQKVFKNTGKLMEKYNVVDTDLESGGGEYPVQDGFGWTNGVLLALLSENV
jgi:alpha,alpha-trehalase